MCWGPDKQDFYCNCRNKLSTVQIQKQWLLCNLYMGYTCTKQSSQTFPPVVVRGMPKLHFCLTCPILVLRFQAADLGDDVASEASCKQKILTQSMVSLWYSILKTSNVFINYSSSEQKRSLCLFVCSPPAPFPSSNKRKIPLLRSSRIRNRSAGKTARNYNLFWEGQFH